MAAGLLRPLFNVVAIIGDGFVQFALLDQGIGQGQASGCVVGLVEQGLLIFLDGVVHLAEVNPGIAQVEMGLGKVGRDAQDRLRFGGGSRKVILMSQCVGEIQWASPLRFAPSARREKRPPRFPSPPTR